MYSSIEILSLFSHKILKSGIHNGRRKSHLQFNRSDKWDRCLVLIVRFLRGKKKQSQLSNAKFIIHFLVIQIFPSRCRRTTGYYSNLQSTLRPCLNLKSRTHNIPHKGMDINGIPIQKFLVQYYMKPRIGQKKKYICSNLKHDPVLVFLCLFFFYSRIGFQPRVRLCTPNTTVSRWYSFAHN